MLEVRAGVQVGRYFPPRADAGIQDFSMFWFCYHRRPCCQLHPSIMEGKSKWERDPMACKWHLFFSLTFFFSETTGPSVHIYNSIDNLKVQLSRAHITVLLLRKEERMGVSDC